MKKIINFLVSFGLLVISDAIADVKVNPDKKNILIFTSKGGGGHMSAANAINDALNKNYNITIKNPICDPDLLGLCDFIKKISFNSIAGEDLYNFLLRHRYNWLINKLNDIGSNWIKTHKNKLKKKFLEYFKNNKVDLIISVIPLLNSIILDVAEKFNIPFLIIPTDLNTATFAFDIKSPKYEKFYFTLAFDDPLLLDQIKSLNICKENLKFIGYPLRKQFFEQKDKEKIREEYNIPKDKPVVMILMGAQGTNSLYSYVYNLSKSKVPMHLITCIGRNEKLRNRISKIILPKHITNSIFGFNNIISDLMTAADFLITKPGSHSCCEALQIGIPILMEQTNTNLYWEKINGDIIKKYKLGEVIKSYKKINKIVEKCINDKNYSIELRLNMKKFKRDSFEKPLIDLVEEILK